MFPPPMIERGQCQNAGYETQDIISQTTLKKRSMPTIVEYDEYPDQKPARQERQWHRQPPGYGQTKVHQVPQGSVGDHSVNNLPDPIAHDRLLVLCHDPFPIRSASLFDFVRSCVINHILLSFLLDRQKLAGRR